MPLPLIENPAYLSSAIRWTGLCRQGAFTLIELLVVMALAALLMATAPPLINAALPGVELKAGARRVVSGLRLAREEAIRNGHDVAFIIDVDGRTVQIEGDFPQLSLPKKAVVKLEAAESEMRDQGVGAIRFFPDGSSTGGRVFLGLEERGGYQIGVTWLTGRIQMIDWDGRD